MSNFLIKRLQGCKTEYTQFSKCLRIEKARLVAKENELKSVFGILNELKNEKIASKSNESLINRETREKISESKRQLSDLTK